MSQCLKVALSSGGNERVFDVAIRRRRMMQNLVMRLKDAGTINVSAPRHVGLGDISDFIKKNSAWIFEELEKMPSRLSLGDYLRKNPAIWVGGLEFKASLIDSRSKPFFLEDTAKREVVFASDSETSLKRLFLNYAKIAIGRTFENIAQSKNLTFSRFSVRDQRSRWGSRSSTGMLSFNWRLVLLPHELQEYVILHEKAHEEFMDHSVSFWIHLNRLCPNAKKLDKALAKAGVELFRIC